MRTPAGDCRTITSSSLTSVGGMNQRRTAKELWNHTRTFGYGPHAKSSRSATRAGLVGCLFETAHNTIAPIWQPGAYIRSSELSSIVEGAHSNDARTAKGWLEHELRHAAETREA